MITTICKNPRWCIENFLNYALKFFFDLKMAEDEQNGEKEEETVYDEEGREELVDGDEVSPEEAGFMKGYEEADEEKKEKDEKEDEEEKE